MIYLLVGHRGVGKTSFLSRIKSYYHQRDKQVAHFDLDREIENTTGLSIAEIFSQEGEEEFRRVEEDTLKELVYENRDLSCDCFISVGAGYEGEIPQDTYVLRLARSTDSYGRIFFDRPRLNISLAPLAEYLERYEDRQNRFLSWAHETFYFQEGEDNEVASELLFLGLEHISLGGCFTLLPENIRDQWHFNTFIEKRLDWGVDLIELRDDLLSVEQFDWALKKIPTDKRLLSWRNNPKIMVDAAEYDWALELGEPNPQATIVSLHQRLPDFDQSLELINEYSQNFHLKLAIEVKSWHELLKGHKWWLEDPKRRSFLPRSMIGHWNWYRLIHKNKMKINFFREGEGSSLEQPTLSEWVNWDSNLSSFAAIVGQPVEHSRTPVEQKQFFKKRDMNILAVDISEDDFCSENIDFLVSLGLRAAAVTSPLKKLAFKMSKSTTEKAAMFSAVNTLVYKNGAWIGHNTDIFGFAKLAEAYKDKAVAVWGSGGTTNVIKEILPNAAYYSARRGELLSGVEKEKYDVVVWGVGAHRMLSCQFAPAGWEPQTIIDLNYSEDSPGREYALLVGANYVSGLQMFKEQAAKQREFWQQELD